jgi:hypothetical protein
VSLPVTVGELNGLAFAGRIAITFRLAERVGASIEILEAIDEGSRQPQKRIRPIWPQLRGLAKCGDGFCQIPLGLGNLASGSFGFSIDSV